MVFGKAAREAAGLLVVIGLLLGACSLACAGPWEAPWADLDSEQAVPGVPLRDWSGDYPITTPRTYTGSNLEYVLMPVGGIGTGSIWIDGRGRLAVWQIFNNNDERGLADSFFAIRAQAGDAPPVTRVLQTTLINGFEPVEDLQFEGGYPIARLSFEDPDLPVDVQLEAFNPMIPTDAANSALPCAVFRITARNSGDEEVKVHALGAMRNALSSPADAGIGLPGKARQDLVREKGLTGMFMHQGEGPLASGEITVRGPRGRDAAGDSLLLVDGIGGPGETAREGGSAADTIATLADMTNSGGGAVLTGVQPSFIEAIARLKRNELWASIEVFEDFESGTYDRWTVEGEAFGAKPHTGTSAGQQTVNGFLGKALVNSFVPNDAPQGRMVSKPFSIKKPFIGFLIGGGENAGKTCLNLVVDNEAVRTATGKNAERLEFKWWDVSDLVGQQATFEIVDQASGGWGHINVDHIFFTDSRADLAMRVDDAFQVISSALALEFEGGSQGQAEDGSAAQPAQGSPLIGLEETWTITDYTQIGGLAGLGDEWRVLATTKEGEPLIISGPMGEARVVLCLSSGLPWSWTQRLLETALGRKLAEGERLTPASEGYGSLMLCSPDAGVTGRAWGGGDTVAGEFAARGDLGDAIRYMGAGGNAAVVSPMVVPPGQERTATFVITWHFPNVTRLGDHKGNLYSRRFSNAQQVARYVTEHQKALWERTQLYHATLYQSNLPASWLDAISSQSVICRGPTVWWAEDGYFAGFEGCYQCCPLNCTHVWNYAQSHARLFPTVGRNMRQSDLLVYMHEDGETSHRQHRTHGAFIDGQAAAIVGAYREHQLSPDASFLRSIWPSLEKATDWLVERIDDDHDGVPAGLQPNTYDCNVSGANTFIGSQYLAALAAAEKMALTLGHSEAAQRWQKIRRAGMANQDERLWNGAHYIQKPGETKAHDYNTGCHSDQLLGQWWAHQLNLGYLYPPQRVQMALQAIMRHNFRTDFHYFTQRPRRYVLDHESGLLMCTWPKGGRPDPSIIYADEVWTGIEYATAGAMIFEGQLDSADRLITAARDRYDGRRRDGLNSGPGGNPFNELECGKFYARAMSSWGILVASQGLVLDGPAGIIGFKPNWQPEDHRSLFTAPEGWGLFVQTRRDAGQAERIELRNGTLRVKELVFSLPEDHPEATAKTTISGADVPAETVRDGAELRLVLAREATLAEGDVIQVAVDW